ncbi:hypothetical protein ES703_19422 [subsurface metagenome]
MKTYPERVKIFRRNERFFRKEGFKFPIADKLIKLAFLDVWDIYHLFYFAKRIPNWGTYLEIGGYKGGSVLCAFEASRVAGTTVNFITIDCEVSWLSFEHVGVIPDLRIIGARSDVAHKRIERNSADLLFIDGAHHYKQVRRDIKNYWPKLKPGGILLGHDYSNRPIHRGVVKAADELFGKKLTVLKNSRVFIVKKSGKRLTKTKGNLK